MFDAIGRFFAYVNWLLNPIHRLSTSEVYDLIGIAALTDKALYLNLGYWRNADTIEDASEALAVEVARVAGMSNADTVLDCGFGFGDQDMLWLHHIGPQRIIGLNITSSQVARARERVADAGLSPRIDLREGSATDMPLDDGSVDLVVALESAFHFDTRQRFFGEALRVLRPGGRLVTADILPMPRSDRFLMRLRQRISWYLVASRFNIPPQNAYTIEPYIEKLQAAGFEDVRVESIRDAVYQPLHDYLAANPAFLERQQLLARLLAKMTLRRSAEHVYAGLDYVIATAEKPLSAERAAR